MNNQVMKWKFTWGEGYYNPRDEILTSRYFQQADGYSLEEIWKIFQLDIGQTIDLSDLSGTHTVTRVQ